MGTRMAIGTRMAVWGCATLLIGGAGCNPTAGQPRANTSDAKDAVADKPPSAEGDASSPRAWLDRMASAYRKAQSYSDEGELTFVIRGATAAESEE